MPMGRGRLSLANYRVGPERRPCFCRNIDSASSSRGRSPILKENFKSNGFINLSPDGFNLTTVKPRYNDMDFALFY
jgi:hypothetical protein